MTTKFKKYDSSKPSLSLLPFEALTKVAEVLDHGATKYGPHNWREGTSWSRLESSLLRHYTAYQSGENYDPESGLLHLAHLACNALFLLTYQLNHLGTDDRRKSHVNRQK